MCLSTAFKNQIGPDHILMKNVQSFEIQGDQVILKNLMEKTLSVHAHVKEANLLDGTIVLTPIEEDAQ